MQFTARDIAILDAVCEMRFLTREQVQELLFSPSTASYCKRRLTLLYHNGYLDRLFAPAKNVYGSQKAIYTLTMRGARSVALARGTDIRVLDWTPDDFERHLFFIEHTLAINEFRIRLVQAARISCFDVHWTDERALRRREMKDYVNDPKQPGQRLAVVPDGHFTLSDDRAMHGFALEIDRATVEEKPFKAKIRALGEWKLTGAYERRYGRVGLRVLFVVCKQTRDPHRLMRIKKWAEAEGGRSLFWFAHLEELNSASLLHSSAWRVADREGLYSLLPSG